MPLFFKKGAFVGKGSNDCYWWEMADPTIDKNQLWQLSNTNFVLGNRN